MDHPNPTSHKNLLWSVNSKILSLINSRHFSNSLSHSLSKTPFEFQSFSLSLHLPLFCSIESKLSPSDFPLFKDSLRSLLSNAVCEMTKRPLHKDSPFHVNAVFDLTNHLQLTQVVSTHLGIPKTPSKTDIDSASKEIEIKRETLISRLNEMDFSPEIKFECRFSRDPVFFAGSYTKNARNVSHSRGYRGDVKVLASVEEVCCDTLSRVLEADDYKFCSSGREDVDVRMLGAGRPFLVKVINPRRIESNSSAAEIARIEEKANRVFPGIVKISGLRIASKDDIRLVKTGENEKSKLYSVKVLCSKEICREELFRKLEIFQSFCWICQKTPLRVMHTRALKLRKKGVRITNLKALNNFVFEMNIKTTSGTYVKEFVNGDWGRTSPSISSALGAKCAVDSLDVLEVCLAESS